MNIAMPLVRIPIGVVVERRKAVSLWCEFVCVGSPSLAGLPEANPWTQLATECGTMTFYAGPAEIELYRTETEKNYRSNLISASPSDWIMLLATASDPPYEISVLTVDPAEAEGAEDPDRRGLGRRRNSPVDRAHDEDDQRRDRDQAVESGGDSATPSR